MKELELSELPTVCPLCRGESERRNNNTSGCSRKGLSSREHWELDYRTYSDKIRLSVFARLYRYFSKIENFLTKSDTSTAVPKKLLTGIIIS